MSLKQAVRSELRAERVTDRLLGSVLIYQPTSSRCQLPPAASGVLYSDGPVYLFRRPLSIGIFGGKHSFHHERLDLGRDVLPYGADIGSLLNGETIHFYPAATNAVSVPES